MTGIEAALGALLLFSLLFNGLIMARTQSHENMISIFVDHANKSKDDGIIFYE